jgi:hypothetical protein
MVIPLIELAIALGLLGSMWFSMEVGRRIGIRAKLGGTEVAQLGTMQGAILGILALLLGLSFSGATTRFVERQDVLVREANSIGTAYLRADLLGSPWRESIKNHLRDYTAARIELFDSVRREEAMMINARLQGLHAEMWSIALEGVAENQGITNAVLPPLNDVIDLLATRNASARRHLPSLVVGLLFASALAAMGTVGYGLGLTKNRHRFAAATLCLLVSVSLWTTIDLDFPSVGLIQINDAPLLELHASFVRTP